jgi:prepilin-type N-terminal cleavage/methylation domain-containing protein
MGERLHHRLRGSDGMRRTQCGFSMIELVVTVLIAGLAFAAMVPLFVNAQQKNTNDNMRNMAANLAQDKMERIRELDYSSITRDNLRDAAFADGQFGQTAVVSTGSGSRSFRLDYEVSTYPSGAGSMTEQYKSVKVDVWWDPPPSPVKHVVLVARVYKQYAGPPIVAFDTNPVGDESGAIRNASQITLTATVDDGWIAQTGKVVFTIAMYGGATVASESVAVTDTTLKTNPTTGDTY